MNRVGKVSVVVLTGTGSSEGRKERERGRISSINVHDCHENLWMQDFF
jgi:hypothetical protein